ncbi:MAG: hypothetical protein IJU23_09255 [Proteobacteria bacterium]|nr:hypothetical protein [Pseudomonadota bacterium]
MSKEFSQEEKIQPIVPLEGGLERVLSGDAPQVDGGETTVSSNPAMGNAGNAPAGNNPQMAPSPAAQQPAQINDNPNNAWRDANTNVDYMRFTMPASKDVDTMQDPLTGMFIQQDEKTGEAKNISALNRHDADVKAVSTDKKYSPVPGGMTIEGDGKPELKDLVVENPSGSAVRYMQGTVDSPNTTSRIMPGLFIDGTPVSDDVHQINIADCYFLAALLQVVHNDPMKIVNMMKLVGDTVSTTFYYRDAQKKYHPVTFNTNLGVLGRDKEGKGFFYFMGAGIRVANAPTRSFWSSSIDNMKLKVDKRSFYEAAYWVNCMEQAYSLYAQQYGETGRGQEQGSDIHTERFAAADYGFSEYCLSFFYGDKAENQAPTNEYWRQQGYGNLVDPNPIHDDQGEFRTQSFDNDGDLTTNLLDDNALVSQNAHIIKQLIKLAQSEGKNNGDGTYMSASISTQQAVFNLQHITGLIKQKLEASYRSGENVASINDAITQLKTIYDTCAEYITKIDTVVREGTGGFEYRVLIDNASLALEKNEAFKALNLSEYQTFREMVGTTVNFVKNQQLDPKLKGVTEGESRKANIFIYSGHAYNIMKASFVYKDGTPVADLTKVDIPNLDPNKSMVTLQNPHGTTRKNLHEDTEQGRGGTFDISLKSLFNNASFISAVDVKGSGQQGQQANP